MTLETPSRQPGAREAAPDEDLQLLQDFVNTNDIESANDALATPDLLREWLTARELLEPGGQVGADEHRRALAVREGLRELGRANNGEEPDASQLAALDEASAALRLAPRLAPGSRWDLLPHADGVDRFLARLVRTVVRAMADGSWPRVKACLNDECRWLFYDRSRNRSSTWCTMSICGARMKARAYRRRRAAAG